MNKQERSRLSHTYQKCVDCGNIIGLMQIEDGLDICTGCEARENHDFIDELTEDQLKKLAERLKDYL